jgi:hypothetical protein
MERFSMVTVSEDAAARTAKRDGMARVEKRILKAVVWVGLDVVCLELSRLD